MTDIEERYRQRWQDKRKKTYDWKRLVIMVLALIGIFILINRLNKVGEKDKPAVEATIPREPQDAGQRTPPDPGENP